MIGVVCADADMKVKLRIQLTCLREGVDLFSGVRPADIALCNDAGHVLLRYGDQAVRACDKLAEKVTYALAKMDSAGSLCYAVTPCVRRSTNPTLFLHAARQR